MTNQLKLINAINKSVFNVVMSEIIEHKYKPYMVVISEYVVGLPPNYSKDKTITFNIDPEAIGKWMDDDLNMYVEMRFNQIPRKITVPYGAVIGFVVMDGKEQKHIYYTNNHEFRSAELLKEMQDQLQGKSDKIILSPADDTAPSETEPTHTSNVVQFKPRAK